MNNEYGEIKISFLEKNKFIIVFSGVFTILAIVIVIVFFVTQMMNKGEVEEVHEDAENNIIIVEEIKEKGLPIGEEVLENGENGNGHNEEWEIENISFGDFYKIEDDSFEPKMNEYDLPLNVKIQVANYYDISRKINLDSGIESLNQNGFTVISSPFPAEIDNFYSTYEMLENNQLPALVSSDFLIYYYQNTLKNVFKDMEASVFYENLWAVNKKLYKTAKERYEKELSLVGVVNDVYLEGARKELAFFATALSLLSPTPEQVEKKVGLSMRTEFSIAEANEFSFVLPEYLKNNVSQEVELIRNAREISKSPVLLFSKNYKDFMVPKRYQENARLNNFYQTSLWLNSVFPLYYKSDSCPDCLLDRDDWRISMCASFLLAEDISVNQELQNRWAKIYKIMSFFEGLRGDLNYLHYDNSFSEVFGKEKTVFDVFSGTKEEIDLNLEKLQKKLFSFDFLEIKGSINKKSTSTMPYLGMKMLTSSYWPNDYIFKQLTHPRVGSFIKGDKAVNEKLNNTYCAKNGVAYRCLGFGFDVMSLIYDINKEDNVYVYENVDYEGYGEQLDGLKTQINSFSLHNWHSNNYWATLDIFKKTLNTPIDLKYVATRNEAYNKKELNTAIASWVNLQLPADVLSPYNKDSFVGLGQVGSDTEFINFSYIEPNIVLVRELIANTKMILEMLTLLKVNEHENTALIDMNSMKDNLEKIKMIIEKELVDDELNDDDYRFINEFIKEFKVKEKGNKILVFEADGLRARLRESIEGIKLLVFTYKKREKNFFAVGPVFNYWEDRK